MLPPSARHPLRGVALIVSAVFMFSSMDTVAKHMLKSYPIGPLIWARYFLQFALMIVIFGPRMGLGLARTRHPRLQILRGLLLVGSTAFFYLSLEFLPLAEAAAITFVGPVLVTAFSGPLLRERVAPRQWFAVMLGFVGVLIIIRPGGGVFSPKVVFPLTSAVFFSFYQIATRHVAGRENPVTTLFFSALVGAVATTLLLPFTWQTPSGMQWVFMPLIGLFGGLGHYLLIRAVEHASPMALAPFVYVQLVWSTLLAWLAFGDFPSAGTLAGMSVVVMAGMFAVNWQLIRQSVARPTTGAGR